MIKIPVDYYRQDSNTQHINHYTKTRAATHSGVMSYCKIYHTLKYMLVNKVVLGTYVQTKFPLYNYAMLGGSPGLVVKGGGS